MRRIFTHLTLIALLLSLGGKMLYAQSAAVTGKVTDENSKPLGFVTVQLEGTQMGAQADIDGNYAIMNVTPGNYNLVASYVGYKKFSQAITVANATLPIDITLHSDAANLNEVVVIGYGTAKKSDLTGSVTSIDSKDFNTGDVQTPEELIQGKVAGVDITPGSGSPGSGATIRIRGLSSISAANDPLYVVDGVPLDVEHSSGGEIGGSPDPLSLINPADIENITILKDASATAIYGSRASNGVVIITTKKGAAAKKLKVSFSSVNSISAISNLVPVLTTPQLKDLITKYEPSDLPLVGNSNTNWQKEIYRIAPGTDDDISFTGGIKNIPYRLSAEYYNQDGILITDNMQRGSVSLNLSPTFFKNTLSVNVNEKASMTSSIFANQGAVGGAVSYDPGLPVYSGSQRFGGYTEWLTNGAPLVGGPYNPVGEINERDDKSNVYRSIGNIQLDYKFPFFPDLHANLNLGYDITEGKGTVNVPDSAASNYNNSLYQPTIKKDSIYKHDKGSYSLYDQTYRNELGEFYLNYKKDVKSIRSVFEAVAGYTYQDFYTYGPNYYAYYANHDTVPGTKPLYPNSNSENTLISFYGRFNYSFGDKYLLTASLRDDGSSRFAPDVRWGLFPSAAFAWRITQEKFMKNVKIFSDLKLRVGYGQTGNQDIFNNYPYINQYTYSSEGAYYQLGNQFYQTLRPTAVDPNIHWEAAAISNIALDYGFIDNRINGSIDFYYKKTTDMLSTITVPEGSNFSNQVLTNVGNMQNQGVEFGVNVVPISKKNMSLEFDYNITYNENKVLSLSKTAVDTGYYLTGGISGGGLSNSIQIIKAGYALNSFYVFKQVYNAQGQPLDGEFYALSNGQPIVVGKGGEAHDSITKSPTNRDLYISNKSPFPKIYMGLTPKFRYKRWSAQIVIRGSFGAYLYNNVQSSSTLNNMLPRANFVNNGTTAVLNYPFESANESLSDFYLQNASFVKIDNINLTYDFGRVYHGKIGVKLSAIVQNVAIFTPYSGLDPEIYGGIDNNIYPRPRIYSLALNIQI